MAPSFFKVLRNPSTPHLLLPPAFVRKHLENNIPNGPIIISAKGEHSWTLKIKKIGDDYYFTNGWKNVVKDIPLVYADFLIFHLVDPSTFNMTIFGANGCEQLLPLKVELEENVAYEFENVVITEDDEQVNGDPFFTSVITKNHKSMLRLPVEFVGLAGINGEGTMGIKNVDGKEWHMRLRVEISHGSKRFYMTGGWRDFVRENHLSKGDECVFRFVKSEGKLLLAKLTKKESQPQPLLAGKQKRGRPAKQPQSSGETIMVTEAAKVKAVMHCEDGEW